VVCAASAEARAKVLLTEDMQDGRSLDGLLLMNPFDATNAKSIDELLAE
jgi:predicted nucleic acid-binding protein